MKLINSISRYWILTNKLMNLFKNKKYWKKNKKYRKKNKIRKIRKKQKKS